MTLYERFTAVSEYYAAGLFEDPDRSLFYRHCRAMYRYYENIPLLPYTGRPLYPAGEVIRDTAVFPIPIGIQTDEKLLSEKGPELPGLFAASDVNLYHSSVPEEHAVAGNMWTHSMPAYERILKEGLNGCRSRVSDMLDREMREGLLLLLDGIGLYVKRCTDYLSACRADERLIQALRKVPFSPAESFFEAVQCWNFLFYLDFCDNLGALLSGLNPYIDGTDPEPLFDCLFENVDVNSGWSMQAGLEDSPLILPALRAVRGKRRPMIEFFVDENTPEAEWDEALDCIKSGTGQPAFYNKRLFTEKFREKLPEVTDADFLRFCGGGCAESMIAGCSNVGSLDAGINLALLFEEALKDDLCRSGSFEEFYSRYISLVRITVSRVTSAVSRSQYDRSKYLPRPVRTLLIDDCIEKEKEYNDGGARYMWSVINFAGTVNVIDSLLSVREYVFNRKEYTKEAFLRLLSSSDPDFLREMRRCPKRFGTDDPEVNAFAHSFTKTVFGFLDGQKPYFGTAFLPASIQFQSYTGAGKAIGATPDGRSACEALADSLSPILGKDTEGPTAMLNSVASLDLVRALGIPIVNLTVNPKLPKGILRALIETFFSMGGIQIQISCVSREILEDAMIHPEKHENLIVRVGGYSDYFNRLDPEIKKRVLDRTIY